MTAVKPEYLEEMWKVLQESHQEKRKQQETKQSAKLKAVVLEGKSDAQSELPFTLPEMDAKVKVQNIPSSMKELNQWLLWKSEIRGEKKTKVPYNAETGKKGKSNDPSTWSKFRCSISVLRKKGENIRVLASLSMKGMGFLGLIWTNV